MATFQDRFKQTIGERGYETSMRRSIQTVILYEAHRCIANRLPSMRPFQRKLAFFDQVQALVDATGFMPHQRQEIMWRTGTSKEAMNAETAWKRLKLIEKEIEKLQEKIKPLCEDGRGHDEIMNSFVQQQFDVVSGTKGKPCPNGWENSHNNVIMTYRMYFDGHEKDPTFPPAVPAKEVVVPAAKPKPGVDDSSGFLVQVPPDSSSDRANGAGRESFGTGQLEMDHMAAAASSESAEDRLAMLKEVRMHLDLLNDFVGIIPQEHLNKRKRKLYQALPLAPPSLAQRSTARRAASGN